MIVEDWENEAYDLSYDYLTRRSPVFDEMLKGLITETFSEEDERKILGIIKDMRKRNI